MTIDSRAFRDALGRFATGVCVVTAVDGPERVIGMTVNSFSAVSLEPPLVLWAIQRDSDRFHAFENAGGFGISVLSHEQEALSTRFAQKDDYYLSPDSYRLGGGGQAVLNQCICSFECRTWQLVEGGDHIIMIGEVMEMDTGAGDEPLLFYGGQYRGLSKS